ncbi:50S ribosomal protein L4 [Phragmitibacter flavus]|uniref:Large ribosomal subunit protein uL4 n=1 Tax=Phragmitibacter flavus TaxID=2576071 RepID=A0A5R8K9W4_9BACT|nr:50S ribosomal protein L4 [Phragmitibacter flavus]TLD69122.1 50S ribosomal protein L4 [Phragmitibacter flavus]
MATTFTLEAAKTANLRLVEEEGKGLQALHDTITAYRANRRQGNANTKSRAEVAGSNKKLWKQKGTGRARMGSARSPIWSGGGVVWGPKTRDWSIKTPKKVKALAFRTALTDRIASADVINVDSFAITDGKTKSFISAVAALSDAKKVLIVSEKFDEVTFRSARNVQSVLLMSAAELNAEHLLNCDKIILVSDALETLARRTA